MAHELRTRVCLFCIMLLLCMAGCDSKKEDTQGISDAESESTSGSKGDTPVVSELFDAIFAQDTEAVKLLCESGVDVNGKSQKDSLRPLDRAAGREGGQEIVMVLIEHGAEVNVTDERGWTPLHFAAVLFVTTSWTFMNENSYK